MIRTVAETGSTNADLLVEAAAGAPEGTWLRAEVQTGGRGRLGRDWRSPAGNLYASTVIRPQPGNPPVASLALVAAVALFEVASAWSGDAASLRIKWPNDLLRGPAKVAGILLERSGQAVVAGFGVNLARAPDLPDRPSAALGGGADPAGFVEDLATGLARWLGIWRGQGLPPVIARWLEAAHPIGTALAATTPAGRIEGLFAGLDAEGNLRLALADGSVRTIQAGDIFLL